MKKQKPDVRALRLLTIHLHVIIDACQHRLTVAPRSSIPPIFYQATQEWAKAELALCEKANPRLAREQGLWLAWGYKKKRPRKKPARKTKK